MGLEHTHTHTLYRTRDDNSNHYSTSDCSAEWLSRVLQGCHYLILSLNYSTSDCSAEWLSRVLQGCLYLILSVNLLPVLYIFLNLFSYCYFFSFSFSQLNSLDIIFKLLKSIIGRSRRKININVWLFIWNMNIKYEILYVMHKNQSNCLYTE